MFETCKLARYTDYAMMSLNKTVSYRETRCHFVVKEPVMVYPPFTPPFPIGTILQA